MRRCQFVHDLRRVPIDVGSPQTQTQRDQVIRIVGELERERGEREEKRERGGEMVVVNGVNGAKASLGGGGERAPVATPVGAPLGGREKSEAGKKSLREMREKVREGKEGSGAKEGNAAKEGATEMRVAGMQIKETVAVGVAPSVAAAPSVAVLPVTLPVPLVAVLPVTLPVPLVAESVPLVAESVPLSGKDDEVQVASSVSPRPPKGGSKGGKPSPRKV